MLDFNDMNQKDITNSTCIKLTNTKLRLKCSMLALKIQQLVKPRALLSR